MSKDASEKKSIKNIDAIIKKMASQGEQNESLAEASQQYVEAQQKAKQQDGSLVRSAYTREGEDKAGLLDRSHGEDADNNQGLQEPEQTKTKKQKSSKGQSALEKQLSAFFALDSLDEEERKKYCLSAEKYISFLLQQEEKRLLGDAYRLFREKIFSCAKEYRQEFAQLELASIESLEMRAIFAEYIERDLQYLREQEVKEQADFCAEILHTAHSENLPPSELLLRIDLEESLSPGTKKLLLSYYKRSDVYANSASQASLHRFIEKFDLGLAGQEDFVRLLLEEFLSKEETAFIFAYIAEQKGETPPPSFTVFRLLSLCLGFLSFTYVDYYASMLLLRSKKTWFSQDIKESLEEYLRGKEHMKNKEILTAKEEVKKQ